MSCQDRQVDLTLMQGASRSLDWKILDATGEPVPLTDAVIIMTVRQTIGGDLTFLKSSVDPLQIEILPQTGDTVGCVVIYILGADTSALPTTSPHVYDIWVDLSDGNSYDFVPPSCLLLLPSVRY